MTRTTVPFAKKWATFVAAFIALFRTEYEPPKHQATPKEWVDGVIRFMANFTSGNSIPIDMVPLARRAGPKLTAEATRLRDMLREARGETWWKRN